MATLIVKVTITAWGLLLPATLATWGVDTGYPNTGYLTLATHKAETSYPDSGYRTLATSNLLPLENGS
ncbi:hypothetical protein DAPPUDRAFT_261463 [Daphnia pulex]|uniref:Uncharacterized protein n=1 Tax=Daphnia pulex TaxID=6669 RepID=E9HL23_DAPPU|nr:hypothetical protein DAPPUDRAFT_261463 [Daphnia pulex]|eukprot:EFX67528.1 hypothetical protein DAPPUDRAFT_261463 [Daphnia pulex]